MNTKMQVVNYKTKNNVDKSVRVFFTYKDVNKLDLYGKDEDFVNQIVDIGLNEKWFGYAFEEFVEVLYYDVAPNEGAKDMYIKNKRIFYAYKLELDKDKNEKQKVLGFIVTDKNYFATAYNGFQDKKECDYVELFAMKRGWRDKGIGRRLLKYTFDTLASLPNSADYAGLYMCPENTRALRVYQLNDFEINQYRDGQAFMCRINDKNLRLLTDIACKGVELAFSQASDKYLKTYFSDVEFMAEKLENDDKSKDYYVQQITEYIKSQKGGLKPVRDIVEEFNSFKHKNPYKTFRDYMDKVVETEEKTNKGMLKNTGKVYKKPLNTPTKSRILKSMRIKFENIISTGRSVVGRNEMSSSYDNKVDNSDIKDR